MKSIGDVGVDEIKSTVAYVKEKEKQAQIVGPLTRRTNDGINLKLLKQIDVQVGNRSDIITGCTMLDNGKVVFSKFNESNEIAYATLNDSNGNYIRNIRGLSFYGESYCDITSIDINTIAVSVWSCITIVNIDTKNVLHEIEND
jgi:outer membrane protein assembly factor BamB